MSELIEIDERKVGGNPVVKGTRIPVQVIKGMVNAGDAPEMVANVYGITEDQVQAAVDYEFPKDFGKKKPKPKKPKK